VRCGGLDFLSITDSFRPKAARPPSAVRTFGTAPLWRAKFWFCQVSVQWSANASWLARKHGPALRVVESSVGRKTRLLKFHLQPRCGPGTASAFAQDNQAQGKSRLGRKWPRSKCARQKNARTGGCRTSGPPRCNGPIKSATKPVFSEFIETVVPTEDCEGSITANIGCNHYTNKCAGKRRTARKSFVIKKYFRRR